MNVLALLAAATVAGIPVQARHTVSPARWVLPSDFPASESKGAVTTFDLTIDEAGRPAKCVIITPSVSEKVDSLVCTAVMKRARFRPARDASGLPVPSVRRDRVVWNPQGAGRNRWFDDADFIVSTPIVSGSKTKTARVIEVMNETGQVAECHVADSSRVEALDQLACSVVRPPEYSAPITNAQGTTVRGIRSFIVGFQSGSDSAVVMR